MPALLPFATAVLIGYLLVRAVRPLSGAGPGWAVAVFEVSLGAGLGVAITSAVFFVLLVTETATPAIILSCDAAMLALLSGVLFFRRGRVSATSGPGQPAVPHGFRWNWLLALILGTSLSMVLAGMWAYADSNPNGLWDAWAIWNIRARFLAGPGEVWRNAISPLLGRTHPDYPLLLSGFIGRCWKVAGNYDTAVPIATAFLFFTGTVGLLVSCLALVRSLSAGLLAGLVLLTGAVYLQQPMAQFADVPLAFYYLAALALICRAWLGQEPGRNALLALAGAAAASAAWTKNEGLVFLAVFCGCCALAEWRFSGGKKAIPRVLWLMVGALPGLILVGWLKLFLAPVADPFLSHPVQRVSQGFAHFHRVWWVVRQIYKWTLEFGSVVSHPLVVLAVLIVALRIAVPRRNAGAVWTMAGTLTLVFGAYCVVSVGTFTPFDRFFSQLWPAFLLLTFMLLRPIEEIIPAPVTKETGPVARGKTKTKKKGKG
jgi:hypothetical protein